jgi:hypothetical protein
MFRIKRSIDGTLGSIAGAVDLGIRLADDEDDEDDENRGEWDTEERFILNLTRMSHETEAVFPEHFIESIVHRTSENVSELVFIESGYTSVLFNDAEFAFPSSDIEVLKLSVFCHYLRICSISLRSSRKLRRRRMKLFLQPFRRCMHRKARLALDKPGVKDKIKQTVEDRRTASQRKSLFKGFGWMFRYLERYGNYPGSCIFQRTIVDVINNRPLQLLMFPSAPSDVVISPN